MAEYIEREAIKKVIQNVFNDLYSGGMPEEITALLECIMVDIGIIPAADVQLVRYSTWEYRTYPIVDFDGVARSCSSGYVCKACGHGEPMMKPYCGGCGATMRGESNET